MFFRLEEASSYSHGPEHGGRVAGARHVSGGAIDREEACLGQIDVDTDADAVLLAHVGR